MADNLYSQDMAFSHVVSTARKGLDVGGGVTGSGMDQVMMQLPKISAERAEGPVVSGIYDYVRAKVDHLRVRSSGSGGALQDQQQYHDLSRGMFCPILFEMSNPLSNRKDSRQQTHNCNTSHHACCFLKYKPSL